MYTSENMPSSTSLPHSFFCTYAAILTQYIKLIHAYTYSPVSLLLHAGRLNPSTQCIATYYAIYNM